MKTAAPVTMSLSAIVGTEPQNPDPFEPERVGHPEKPNQFLGVDVLEWYHPAVRVRQREKHERVVHPPCHFEGDAICSSGHPPQAIPNIESDNNTNMLMAAPFGAAVDAAAGPADSILFGRGYYGRPGLLNDNRWLRLGWGWKEEIQRDVFRFSGRLIGGWHWPDWPVW
jgi:hypothetical protein